jgi:hypothetical protein
MGDTSSLGLLFEIAADPSKGIAATEQFRDRAGAVGTAAKRIKIRMEGYGKGPSS